jgi:hypothetical protein
LSLRLRQKIQKVPRSGRLVEHATAVRLHWVTSLRATARAPFVIPTAAEGSAVPLPWLTSLRSTARPPFVIPTAVEGSAVPLPRLTSLRSTVYPLSSRPQRRDLQFLPRLTSLRSTARLPFVIPTAVEGSAVPSPVDEPKVHSPSTLCHPDRSGGICSSFPC